MNIAIFPGTFDPMTTGHINVLKRACKLFDKVIVLVAINPEKNTKYTIDERVNEIKTAIAGIKNASVDSTDGLTVAYAKEHGAKYLVRGLRNDADFEFEYQLMLANKIIEPSIETIFLLADESLKDVSSTKARKLIEEHKDVSKLIPKYLLDKLK